MSKLTILGNTYYGIDGTSNNVSISWSDDDQTWTTPVTFPAMLDYYSTSRSAYRLGSFRRRRFKFTLSNGALWIIYGVEVNINKGTS